MPILCVLGTVWLWSLIPLAVKVAYQSFNFGFIALSRLAIGTLVFGALELTSGRGLRLPPRQSEPKPDGFSRIGPVGWVIIAGLAIGGDLLLYTLGLRYTTASAATLIVSTDGVMLAMLGVLVLKERISLLKALAALSALAGLVLVGWNGQDLGGLVRSEYFLGNAIVLSAGVCWATYGLGQRVLAQVPGSALFPIFLVGTVVAAAATALQPATNGPIRWQAVGALLFLGLGATGLAYVLLAKGMRHLEAATVGLVGSTLPLFTMVEARLLLREEITSYLLAGAAFIMGGVALIVRHQSVYGRP
ncbi:MAG TPA: DMT family transporter [Armatimonadota bacterium]|nr:DMT family transporter [Armatimonadota bacterium]